MDQNKIQEKILDNLSEKLSLLDMKPEEVVFQESLLTQGVLDSVSFIEFLTTLEEEFDIEIAFDEMDMADLTNIEKLSEVIANELQK